MPSLLSIPQELRDQIIENVIINELKPPEDTKSAELNRSHSTEFDYPLCRSWSYGPQHVRYAKGKMRVNSASLLQVNKQLNEETKAALARRYPEGVKYKLDIMFVNEIELWPTWLLVPSVSHMVAEVDVKIRIVGEKLSGSENAFKIGDGSPEQIVWCFYYVLEHFLDYGLGPSLGAKEGIKIQKRPTSVRNIKLDIVYGNSGHGIPQGSRSKRQDPQWLANFVCGRLNNITEMSYHTAPYGMIVYERVGKFQIAAESEIIEEINLGDSLARLNYGLSSDTNWYTGETFGNLPGDCRLITFWNWKHRAVKKRRQLDLPVSDDVVWPKMNDMARWRQDTEVHRAEQRAQGLAYFCKGKSCFCSDHRLEDMLLSRNIAETMPSMTLQELVESWLSSSHKISKQ
jgi:hypothetical protein